MSARSDPLHFIAAVIADSEDDDILARLDEAVRYQDLWPELALLAISQGVGPLFLRQVQNRFAGHVGEEALTPLLAERNEAAIHHMLASQARRRVDEAFRQADIPGVWLKGIVLAHTVYPSPELRPMVDLDVLVPYARRREALAVAESIDFHPDTPLLFDGREGLKHHYHLESRNVRPLRLELHFRLLGTMDRVLTVEQQGWFWHYVEEVTSAEGDKMSVLRPEAHMLYLCGHAMLQHGESDLRLLRLYDLDRIASTRPAFDWGLLVEGAVQLRWTYAVARALSLAKEYFGASIPQGVHEALARQRSDAEEIAHVIRRQSRRTKSEAVLHNLAAMAWGDRIRAAGRIVIPPPSYMRWRYRVNNDRGLPAAYVKRLRFMAWDAFRSVRRRTGRNL